MRRLLRALLAGAMISAVGVAAVVPAVAAVPAAALPSSAVAAATGAAGTWSRGPDLATDRLWPTATPLSDGRVLVVGGGKDRPAGGVSFAEIYDPVRDTWQPTAASEHEARTAHAAVPLNDTQVLLVGGLRQFYGNSSYETAVVYDVAADTWRRTSRPPLDSQWYAAARLSDGRVLAVGSSYNQGQAALYLPASDSWQPVPAPRCGGADRPSLVLLPDGRVMLGSPESCPPQLFDPVTTTWSLPDDPGDSFGDAGTPIGLPHGDVLVGGRVFRGSADVWRSSARPAGAPRPARVLTAKGAVVAGGGSAFATYVPQSDLWIDLLPPPEPIGSGAGLAPLPSGEVLVLGGARRVLRLDPHAPPSNAEPDVGQPSLLRATVLPTRTTADRPVALTARLATPTGAPLAGEPVHLHELAHGATSWSHVGTATTDVDGLARFERRPRQTTAYALRHPRSAGAAQAAVTQTTVEVGLAAKASRPEVVVLDAGDGLVDVRWLPPADDGGSAVQGYSLSTYPVTTTTEVGPEARHVRLSGLNNGTSYQVHVAARNAAGVGDRTNDTALPEAGRRTPDYASPPGRAVCGRLPAGEVRWSAGATVVCPQGAVVGAATTLVLDGEAGPLDVGFTGPGGLLVAGGSVRTEQTSPGSGVLLHSVGDSGHRWRGLVEATESAGFDRIPVSTSVSLAHVELVHSRDGLWATQVPHLALRDVAIRDTAGHGVRATAESTVLDDVRVDTAGGNGVDVGCPEVLPDGRCTISLARLRVDRAGWLGLNARPQGTTGSFRVRDVVVTRSGHRALRHPAAYLRYTGSLGPDGDVDGISGGGNAIDAVALDMVATGDLDWVTPQVTPAEAPRPLGYVGVDLTMRPGTDLRVAPGSVVKWHVRRGSDCGQLPCRRPAGGVRLDDAAMTATGATFTAASDDTTAGPSLCPSVFAHTCAPAKHEWSGVHVTGTGRAVIDGSTLRFASVGLKGDGAMTVTGSTFAHTGSALDAGRDASTGSTADPVSVAGSTFTDTAGITVRGAPRVSVTDSSLRGGGVSVYGDTALAADSGACTPSSGVTLERLVIEEAPQAGILVSRTCRPAIRDNVVRRSGYGAPPAAFASFAGVSPAIMIGHSEVSVGDAGDVARNTGSRNAVEAVHLDGLVVGDLAWRSPVTRVADGPLGYTGGRLRMRAPDTMRLPAGALVKFWAPRGGTPGLDLQGASLDGSAGGALLTEGHDVSVAPVLPCGDSGCPRWTGIRLTAESKRPYCEGVTCYQGRTGDLLLDSADVRGTVVAHADLAAPPSGRFRVTGTTIFDRVGLTGVLEATVTDSVVHGILAAGAGSTTIERNTVPHARGAGILVDGRLAAPSHSSPPTVLSVKDNLVRSSVGPAVVLRDLRTSVGPGAAVDGNLGERSGQFLAFAGAVLDGGLAWVTPSTEDGRRPLGHVAGRFGDSNHPEHDPIGVAALDVVGPAPLVLPRDSVVKATTIRLSGAPLDATAGGAVVADLTDPLTPDVCPFADDKPSACHRRTTQPLLHARRAAPLLPGGSVDLVEAQVRGRMLVETGAASGALSDEHGLVVRDSTVFGSVTAVDTPSLLERSSVFDTTHLRGAAGHQLRDSTFSGWLSSAGVRIEDAATQLDHSTVTGSNLASQAAAGGGGVVTSGSSLTRLTCATVEGNIGGLVTSAPAELVDVNLTGNARAGNPAAYDLDSSAPVTASGVWWGQPEGPVEGQVRDPSLLDRAADAAARVACAQPRGPAPASVVDVRGTPTATGAVVRWQPGRTPAAGFRVTAEPGERVVEVSARSTEARFRDLAAGTTYRFSVVAYGPGGTSAPAGSGDVPVTGHGPRLSDVTATGEFPAQGRYQVRVTGRTAPNTDVLFDVEAQYRPRTATVSRPDGSFETVLDLHDVGDGTYKIHVVSRDPDGAGDWVIASVDKRTSAAQLYDLRALPKVGSATQSALGTGVRTRAGTRVRFSLHDVEGRRLELETTADAGGAANVSFDATPLVDGPLTIEAYAVEGDRTGSPLRTTSRKDTVAPVVTDLVLTDPVTADNEKDVRVRARTEPGANVSVTIVGEDRTGSTQSVLAAPDGTVALSFDVSRLPAGRLTTTANAMDDVNNRGPSTTATATKLSSPPEAQPSPSPSGSASASPSGSASPSPSPTPSPTPTGGGGGGGGGGGASPSPLASASPTGTPTASPTASPAPSASPSPDPSPSPSPTLSPSPGPTPTGGGGGGASPSSSASASPTGTPAASPTASPAPSASPSPEPSPSPSPAPTGEPTSPPDEGPAGPQARTTEHSCPDGRVPGSGFDDVAADSVHGLSVDCVVWWKVAQGKGGATYAPAAEVTRAQMATFIANVVLRSGGQLPPADRDWFPDDQASTHEDNINRLAAAGVVSGRADGTYDPDAAVTRGQMTKFLVLAYEYRSGRTLRSDADYFSDDDGTTHEGTTNRAAAAGFTGGASDGTYRPALSVRRDQMASFTARLLDLLVEADGARTPG